MNRFIQKHISKSGVSFHVTLFTLLFTLSSCSDYLDVLPLNEVVLENYWTKKDDVTSVLNGCYESLTSEGSLERMGIWVNSVQKTLCRVVTLITSMLRF
jgi:hypothetical protein